MKNAILVHGWNSKEEYFGEEFPSPSNSHWFPWLQKQLLIIEIQTQTPEMPLPYKPQYGLWKAGFENFKPENADILVGHSCGGGFLTRWLSESKTSHETVVLVAPWLDPYREETTDFFEFEIDTTLTSRIANFHLFVSSDDEESIANSLLTITTALPSIKVHHFENKGHFITETIGTIFPELLEAILKIQTSCFNNWDNLSRTS